MKDHGLIGLIVIGQEGFDVGLGSVTLFRVCGYGTGDIAQTAQFLQRFSVQPPPGLGGLRGSVPLYDPCEPPPESFQIPTDSQILPLFEILLQVIKLGKG